MVTKYKIDAIPTEIDPQGEYTYRDPETGAAALMAPTREGDRLELLLGGLSFAAIARVMGLDLDALARLGGGATDPLTFDGQPIGGATPAPILALTTAPTLGTITAGMVPGDVTIDEGLATRTPAGAVTATTALRRTPVATADLAGWDAGTGWISAAAAEGENVILRVTYTAEDAASLVAYATTSVQAAVAETAELVSNVDGTLSYTTSSNGDMIWTVADSPNGLNGTYTVTAAQVAAGARHNALPPAVTLSGETLSLRSGLWFARDEFGDLVITRRWLRNGAAITGETGATYALVAADRGTNVTCEETATNDVGSTVAISNAAAIPAAVAPSNTILPAISGLAEVGQRLSASTGTWTGTAPITYTYQWNRNGSPIAVAWSSNYSLVAADEGAVITCTVMAMNDAAQVQATSAGTDPVTAFSAPTAFVTFNDPDRAGGMTLTTGVVYDGTDIVVALPSANGDSRVTGKLAAPLPPAGSLVRGLAWVARNSATGINVNLSMTGGPSNNGASLTMGENAGLVPITNLFVSPNTVTTNDIGNAFFSGVTSGTGELRMTESALFVEPDVASIVSFAPGTPTRMDTELSFEGAHIRYDSPGFSTPVMEFPIGTGFAPAGSLIVITAEVFDIGTTDVTGVDIGMSLPGGPLWRRNQNEPPAGQRWFWTMPYVVPAGLTASSVLHLEIHSPWGAGKSLRFENFNVKRIA